MTNEPGSAGAAGQQQLLEAMVAVDRGLTCVKFSLDVAHPDEGCLPLPDLRVPYSVEELKTYAAEVDASLWHDQHWTAAWTTRLKSCPHKLGPYGVTTVFDLIQAWRALVSRAADHATQRQSDDPYTMAARLVQLARIGARLVALAQFDDGVTSIGVGAAAVDEEVVAFVRLGFGDVHGLRMRSLSFEVAIPNRATLEAALVRGVVGYNRMSGKVAAQRLGGLWDDVSYTYLGRDSDPYLRLWLPRTRQQRNGGDNGASIPTTDLEMAGLIGRIQKAAKACTATALVRSTSHTANWSLAVPPDPSEMLLIWQD